VSNASCVGSPSTSALPRLAGRRTINLRSISARNAPCRFREASPLSRGAASTIASVIAAEGVACELATSKQVCRTSLNDSGTLDVRFINRRVLVSVDDAPSFPHSRQEDYVALYALFLGARLAKRRTLALAGREMRRRMISVNSVLSPRGRA